MYVDEFGYTPAQKTVETAKVVIEGASYKDSVLAFVQVEESDEAYDVPSRSKKLSNHLKWVARKNQCNSIILHSFAHLSDSKASLDFTVELFNQTEKRLHSGGYNTEQTPFGYFLNLEIKAPGYSLARIWASF